MTRKARISAESLPELRDFLAGAQVDMGCRPVAVKRGDRFATTVISERRGARPAVGAARRQRADRGARGSAQSGGPPADGARGQPLRRRPGAARPRGEGVGDELPELRRDRHRASARSPTPMASIAGWSSCRTRASRAGRCWRSDSATRCDADTADERSMSAACTRASGFRPTRCSTSAPTCSRRAATGVGLSYGARADRGRRGPPDLRAAAARSSCPAPTPTAGSTARRSTPTGARTGRLRPTAAASASTSTATSTWPGISAGPSRPAASAPPTIPATSTSTSDRPPRRSRRRATSSGCSTQYPGTALVPRRPRRGAGGLPQLGARREPERRSRRRTSCNPGFDGQRGIAGDGAYREYHRRCGRVPSCAGCRELMAAEIDEGAQRPSTTSRPPSRSTRPPAPATTMPTAGIEPIRRCRRCSASRSSAATTSSRNGRRPRR